MPSLEDFVGHVPDSLLRHSGGLFYSGRNAFSGHRAIYLLGLNPGGDEAEGETSADGEKSFSIRKQIEEALTRSDGYWSAFLDECWKGCPKGEQTMQKRVRHLLSRLELDPRQTPASNLVFVRTRSEAGLAQEIPELAEKCWPFHQSVIDGLGVSVIICFHRKAGDWVRRKLGAETAPFAKFSEKNHRRWESAAYRAKDGRVIISVPHPSRSDWSVPECDPTGLIEQALKEHKL